MDDTFRIETAVGDFRFVTVDDFRELTEFGGCRVVAVIDDFRRKIVPDVFRGIVSNDFADVAIDSFTVNNTCSLVKVPDDSKVVRNGVTE